MSSVNCVLVLVFVCFDSFCTCTLLQLQSEDIDLDTTSSPVLLLEWLARPYYLCMTSLIRPSGLQAVAIYCMHPHDHGTYHVHRLGTVSRVQLASCCTYLPARYFLARVKCHYHLLTLWDTGPYIGLFRI